MDPSHALSQIRKLLPLDDESLKQILAYSNTLSNEGAAEHLKNLLGDGPQALDFISFYNSKRRPLPSASTSTAQGASFAQTIANTQNKPSSARLSAQDEPPPPVPKVKVTKKKKADFNKLPPPRQVEGHGHIEGAYIRPSELDYMARKAADIKKAPSPQPQSRLPPSAAGKLISDQPTKKATPSASAPKTVKVSLTGGVPMKGKSTALNDLELVIRNLEMETNPTLAPTAEENARRKCGCMATRHDLLTAAPNCLNCGKIICVKEGVGPCTFCGTALLGPEELAGMIRVLREENGREKMEAKNQSHRRADVATTPRQFADRAPVTAAAGPAGDKLDAATKQRDKLLAYQAENAKRTRVHDEAADFDVPSAGTNIWDTPQKRAMELKKQQKALREMEWRAKPEWERRKVVASIEIGSGKGKVVRKMVAMDKPEEVDVAHEYVEEEEDLFKEVGGQSGAKASGLSRNPLLASGGLIRPVAKIQGKGKNRAPGGGSGQTGWRRVQDDNNDNEKWILDGGIQGGKEELQTGEEPPCG
jgi:hypothetical protein